MAVRKRLVVGMFGAVLALSACGAQTSSGGKAQVKLPSTVEIVVPFKPGGSSDVTARVFQPYFQKALGVPVVVQNMTGGTGNTGLSFVARHRPDGSVLGIDILPSESLVQKLGKTGFNEATLTPIANIGGGNDEVLGVLANSPFKSLKDLANHTGAPLRIGVAGFGSNGEIVYALLHADKAFHNFVLVPYQGGGAVLTALLGHQIDVAVTGSAPFARFVKAGHGRGLVTFGSARSPFLPDVLTAAQEGYGALTMNATTSLVGPPGMNPALAARLSAAALQAMRNPKFVAAAKKASLAVAPSGAKGVRAIVSRDDAIAAKVLPIIRQLGKG